MRFSGFWLMMSGLLSLCSPATSQAATVHNIAVFGDSLADGIWAGLFDKTNADPDYRLFRDSKVGAGLTRPDYDALFNDFAASLAQDHVTDAVIMFGANDDEGLRDDNHKAYLFESPGWVSTYEARMAMIIAACQQHGIKVIWVGLPVMRAPDRNQDALFMNAMLQRTVQAQHAIFLPLEDDFKGPDGGFALYLPDPDKKLRQVRAPDGTHFTRYGYDLIASQVVAVIEAPVAAPAHTAPAANPAPSAATPSPPATPGPPGSGPSKPASAAPAQAASATARAQ